MWLGGALVFSVAMGEGCAVARGAPASASVAVAGRGAELFARHCALCHGPRGRGNGEAAPVLFPPARDFGRGEFRLVRTQSGAPTDDDLMDVLARGMPGSAMPSFAWLPTEDRRALVAHVRALATAGLAETLQEVATRLRAPLAPGEAQAQAVARLTPGPVIDPGRPAPATAAARAHGRELYERECASCHGPRGGGDEARPPFAENDAFAWARDFTRGVLKGGAGHRDLAWRIRAGLPGSTMPPTPLAGDDLAALVAYVQSLLGPDAETKLVQRREELRAKRVANLPSDPVDPVWRQGDEVRLTLAPLHWRETAVLEAFVTALHDGDDVAVRVRWPDATRDDRPLAGAAYADAVALQWSDAADPPLFGMGARDHAVTMWHWKPFSTGDVSALLEQLDRAPHARRSDAVVYAAALREAEAREVSATGLASAPRFVSDSLALRSAAEWGEGEWRVVLRRSLVSPTAAQIGLRPGARVQVACAIWNGAARDRDAEKSITIWHSLVLDGSSE